MKKLFFLVGIVFFNCSNKSNTKNATINSFVLKEDSIICVNKNLKIVLFLKDSKFEKFKLYNTEKNLKVEGKPELITIDGEIPQLARASPPATARILSRGICLKTQFYIYLSKL